MLGPHWGKVPGFIAPAPAWNDILWLSTQPSLSIRVSSHNRPKALMWLETRLLRPQT